MGPNTGWPGGYHLRTSCNNRRAWAVVLALCIFCMALTEGTLAASTNELSNNEDQLASLHASERLESGGVAQCKSGLDSSATVNPAESEVRGSRVTAPCSTVMLPYDSYTLLLCLGLQSESCVMLCAEFCSQITFERHWTACQ